MADLLAHYVSARLPGSAIRDPAVRAALVLGVFLPDLVSKPLSTMLGMPDGFNAPAHSLLGLLILSYLAALFFSAEFRGKAWAALYGGALLHVGVDLFKDNLGSGSAFLLHPFTRQSFEIGLYYNEDVVFAMPVCAGIALLLWKFGR